MSQPPIVLKRYHLRVTVTHLPDRQTAIVYDSFKPTSRGDDSAPRFDLYSTCPKNRDEFGYTADHEFVVSETEQELEKLRRYFIRKMPDSTDIIDGYIEQVREAINQLATATVELHVAESGPSLAR